MFILYWNITLLLRWLAEDFSILKADQLQGFLSISYSICSLIRNISCRALNRREYDINYYMHDINNPSEALRYIVHAQYPYLYIYEIVQTK